jgi:dihydrolipoamide dehydrogenase
MRDRTVSGERATGRLLVIGGGIGGYTAAIRGARHGLDVTLVEAGELGGTCLNVGCIPTKSLLHQARAYRQAGALARFGVRPEALAVDVAAVMRGKDHAVRTLVNGVRTLVRRNRIELVAGTAEFDGARSVRIRETGASLAFEWCVIATGSVPIVPPIPGVGLDGVITSDGAVSIAALPSRLLIVGGGVLGVEFAQIFDDFGCRVTIVERLERLLGDEDPDVSAALAASFSARGVRLVLGATVDGVARVDSGLELSVATAGGGSVEHADAVLLAVGRRPRIDALSLAAAGVRTEHGAVATDDRCRTSSPHIFAVGDVRGGLQLAHKAAADAEAAIAGIVGRPSSRPVQVVPRAVYTSPAVAAVGLTELQARNVHPGLKVGRFPLSANGKALADEDSEGFVKIVADGASGQIVGISMVGTGVTELLGEATLAVQMELTLAALAETIHPHPTLSEALVEAAHDALDRGAIHLPPRAAAPAAIAPSPTPA